jgi:hypothetical protein
MDAEMAGFYFSFFSGSACAFLLLFYFQMHDTQHGRFISMVHFLSSLCLSVFADLFGPSPGSSVVYHMQAPRHFSTQISFFEILETCDGSSEQYMCRSLTL